MKTLTDFNTINLQLTENNYMDVSVCGYNLTHRKLLLKINSEGLTNSKYLILIGTIHFCGKLDLKNVSLHIYKEVKEESGEAVFTLIAINEDLKINFTGGTVLVTEQINESELQNIFTT